MTVARDQDLDCMWIFYVDFLSPDPDTPTIINGGVMHLTGPCFSMDIQKIKCNFTDIEGDVTTFTFPNGIVSKPRVISGITVNEQAICPLPLFRRLGIHNVTVTLNDDSEYIGTFLVGKLHNT